LAERYFRDDPNTCLIKLRQFGEVLAQLTAAKVGLLASPEEPQVDLLRRLKFEGIVPREVGQLFHQVRIAGIVQRMLKPTIMPKLSQAGIKWLRLTRT
jgi:type I restriction enzyme R subunit